MTRISLRNENLPSTWEQAVEDGRLSHAKQNNTLYATDQLNVLAYNKGTRTGAITESAFFAISGVLLIVSLVIGLTGSVFSFDSYEITSAFVIFILIIALTLGAGIVLITVALRTAALQRKWHDAENRDIDWLSQKLNIDKTKVPSLLNAWVTTADKNNPDHHHFLYIGEDNVAALFTLEKRNGAPKLIKLDNNFRLIK
jgi:hypothetical protein